MEKRVLLAILLSFGVFAVYQRFFAPPDVSTATQTSQAPAAAGALAPASSAAPAGTAAPSAAAPATASQPLIADSAARDIIVDTDNVHAVFSTSGATLRSWKLKHYLEGGQPLELVPTNLPETYDRPFTMTTADPAISRTLATALFKPNHDGLSLGPAPGALTFEYRDEAGLNARKTFYFQPDGKPYILRVEASIDQGGQTKPVTLGFGPALGLGYAPDGSRTQAPRAIQERNDKVERLSSSSVDKQGHYDGEMRFAGVEDQYFLSVVLPGTTPIAVDYASVTLPVGPDPNGAKRTFVAYKVGESGALALPFFLGPKDLNTLRAVDPELVRGIDFGIFSWLVVPMLQALRWINGFVGNWGWSIVVLTVLINIVLFPLRHRSMVSMRKLSAIQPEMKVIQERYAKYKITDPERQKMNQEMMALYKQTGASPASGCLPMLLTLPLLYAFYAMLFGAIELRGAPFMLWIHDLSRHDPLYITPLLMGATMLWQQRMMPVASADPVQQKMMLFMPVIFTVSFLWVSAGTVLYWLVSNLMAISQQYVTIRTMAAPARSGVPARARPASNSRAGKS